MEYLPYTFGLIFMVNLGKYTSPMDRLGMRINPHKTPRPTQGPVAGVWVASERSSGCKHWSPRTGYVWRWTHFVISAWNIVDFFKGVEMTGWFTVGWWIFSKQKGFDLDEFVTMLFGSPMNTQFYGGYIHGGFLFGCLTWSAKVMEISSSLGFGNSVQHTAREIPEVCSSNSGTTACEPTKIRWFKQTRSNHTFCSQNFCT